MSTSVAILSDISLMILSLGLGYPDGPARVTSRRIFSLPASLIDLGIVTDCADQGNPVQLCDVPGHVLYFHNCKFRILVFTTLPSEPMVASVSSTGSNVLKIP